MKIYFACAIIKGHEDEPTYQKIVAALQENGHEVPTALLAGPDVAKLETIVDLMDVYTRDIGWMDECDLLVAEVSTPSHGVGYEIGYALNQNKPVLCLHQAGVSVSKMIMGNTNLNLTVLAYNNAIDAVKLLERYLSALEP